MDTLDTGYLGYLCIADTAVLQIQAKIKYCICIHGYVRIHVPPGVLHTLLCAAGAPWTWRAESSLSTDGQTHAFKPEGHAAWVARF